MKLVSIFDTETLTVKGTKTIFLVSVFLIDPLQVYAETVTLINSLYMFTVERGRKVNLIA